MSSAPRGVPGRDPQADLLVDLYELTMGESYCAEGLAERTRHLPGLVPEPAARLGLPARRGHQRAARRARGVRLRRRAARVPRDDGALQPRLPRAPRRLPLQRRGSRAARGDGLLRRRAAARADRAHARGADRRDDGAQPAALPLARRDEGGALRRCRGGSQARRLQPPPHPRRGRRRPRRPRQLPRGLRLDEQHRRREAPRHTALRHDGALLRRGLRRRERRLRGLHARLPGRHDPPDRQLRLARGCAPRDRGRADAARERRQARRGAARLRRPRSSSAARCGRCSTTRG